MFFALMKNTNRKNCVISSSWRIAYEWKRKEIILISSSWRIAYKWKRPIGLALTSRDTLVSSRERPEQTVLSAQGNGERWDLKRSKWRHRRTRASWRSSWGTIRGTRTIFPSREKRKKRCLRRYDVVWPAASSDVIVYGVWENMADGLSAPRTETHRNVCFSQTISYNAVFYIFN